MKNKNIFLLSTDKESLLHKSHDMLITSTELTGKNDFYNSIPQFIYITNDEPIKINEPYLGEDGNIYYLCEGGVNFNGKKIVLTNDTSLIEDGVQAVDNLFLSFYAENTPDYVEVKHIIKEYVDDQDAYGYDVDYYSLNFPQKDKFTEETERFVKEQSDKYKKWAERNKTDYDRLLSQFEDMQGITSNNFDEKDWNKFDRYVKGQIEENWIFEISSGYAGYRNTETNEWIYEKEYLEKFGEKEKFTEKIDKEMKNDSHERFLENIKRYKCVSLDEYEKQEAENYRKNKKLYTKEEVIEIIKKYNNGNNTLFFDTDKKDVLNNWIENNL